MASYKALFPSTYLKKEDFPTLPAARTCTIREVSTATIKTEDDGEEVKPVVKFEGMDKAMVLNWGNADEIASAYGEETNGWIGKQIEVYHDPSVKFGQKKVGGIRVRIPMGTHQAQAKEAQLALTWDQAVLACYQANISKSELIAELQKNGRKGYDMLRDTPLVKQMIEAKEAKLDKSNDANEVPFGDENSQEEIPF